MSGTRIAGLKWVVIQHNLSFRLGKIETTFLMSSFNLQIPNNNLANYISLLAKPLAKKKANVTSVPS